MARASKIETCMFCMMSPCACDAQAKKPKSKPKPKAPPPEVVVAERPPGAFQVASGAEPAPVRSGPFAGFKSPSEQLMELDVEGKKIFPEVSQPKIRIEAPKEDDMIRAVRLVVASGMAHPDEVKKYTRVLPPEVVPTPELSARLGAWRREYGTS